MKQIRILGLAILAMFALSAIVATAAQAKSGPFFMIKGTRLASGQTASFTATSQSATFVLKATGVTITCKKLKVEAGAEIIGSSGSNSSTNKEVVVFEECSLAGNGTKCILAKADKGVIKTEAVKSTLDYPKKVPAEGDIKLVLFQPEVGAVFVKIKVEAELEGTCTVVGSLAVEGSTLGVLENEKFEPFRLKIAVPETKNILVKFPSKNSESCTEKEGVITCIKHKLTLASKTAELEGHAQLTLAGTQLGNIWGILSE
jgi:hypothetical protein